MSNIIRFPPRLRAVGPNDVDHVAVWGGISKETRRPIYGVDFVFGDGGRASMSWRETLSDAMSDAREMAAEGPYPIREREP